ncbi:MAG TPA: hypothetical protein VJZ75_04030 [Candidatus Bathyarchaeia archaeon]|nr:hypothetical protein [Candidatus Bathyarchaeia archaeon]
MKYSVAGILLVITIVGFSLSTSLASAQNASGSFNPQAKFLVGSSFSITSVYGIAMVPSNQSNVGHHSQPHQEIQAPQQDSEVSNTSIIVNGQVVNQTKSGGVQWTVKSGTIVIKQNTLTIANGKGEIDSLDRVVMDCTTTDATGHTVKLQLTGLAANYNGTLIAELNGNSSNEPNRSAANGNVFENISLTYIATIS